MTPFAVYYEVLDAGAFTRLATVPLVLTQGIDHTLLVKFNGPTVAIWIDGKQILRLTDSRIQTLGRKVACFEPYEPATSGGYAYIKSGYSISGQSQVIPAAQNLRSSFRVTSIKTLSGEWTDLNLIPCPGIKTAMIFVRFRLSQTAAGKIYLGIKANALNGGAEAYRVVTMHNTIANEIVSIPVYAEGIEDGTVQVQVATDGVAAATLPITTDLDDVEVLVIPVT